LTEVEEEEEEEEENRSRDPFYFSFPCVLSSIDESYNP